MILEWRQIDHGIAGDAASRACYRGRGGRSVEIPSGGECTNGRVLIAIREPVDRGDGKTRARGGLRGGACGSATDNDLPHQFKMQNAKCKLQH
jgi:hypothetical protein